MLYLLYKNVTGFITRHKLIFFLFCLSQVVSILAVLFMSGLTSSAQTQNAQYSAAGRTLVVQPGGSFDAGLKDSVNTLCAQKAEELRGVSAHLEAEKTNATVLCGDALHSTASIGRYFSKQELEQGERKAVASSKLCKGEKIVGDSLELLGNRYEIIGFHEFMAVDEHEIPFASLSDYGKVTSVSVILKDTLTEKQAEQWRQYLEGIFPSSLVEPPQPQDLNTKMHNAAQLLTSMATGLIAVLNFSYLYRYILERRKGAYAILRMCGCSRLTGFVLFALEALAFSTVLFWLCAGVFHFGLSRIYQGISGSLSYAMGWKDFLPLYLIYLAVVLLVFSFTIRRYSRQTPRQLYTGGAK